MIPGAQGAPSEPQPSVDGPRVSVILTTYKQPRALTLALWGYARQSFRGFELLLADDGSGPRTRAVARRLREETGLGIRHVWHPDRGFRKTEILNRAVVASRGDYLIFPDGDCIPRDDFVGVHLQEARPLTFLSGGYLKLPRELSEALTSGDVRSGRAFEASWLTERGWQRGRRRLRLTRSRRLASVLDGLTPTRATWNGHDASTWKSLVVAANGFDLDMGYGGLDRALGERLVNGGVTGKQIRHRATCLHLWHPRPYRRPEVVAANRAIRNRMRTHGEVRARRGIAELGETDAPT